MCACSPVAIVWFATAQTVKSNESHYLSQSLKARYSRYTKYSHQRLPVTPKQAFKALTCDISPCFFSPRFWQKSAAVSAYCCVFFWDCLSIKQPGRLDAVFVLGFSRTRQRKMWETVNAKCDSFCALMDFCSINLQAEAKRKGVYKQQTVQAGLNQTYVESQSSYILNRKICFTYCYCTVQNGALWY